MKAFKYDKKCNGSLLEDKHYLTFFSFHRKPVTTGGVAVCMQINENQGLLEDLSGMNTSGMNCYFKTKKIINIY